MTFAKTLLSGATAITLTAGAAFADENPMVGGAAMFEEKNIVENAVNSADHTTLVAAVQAAGLVDTLASEGPFTVFAPVNSAFAALPGGTVETLLKPENKDQLTKIVDDGGKHPVPTLGGCTLQASYVDGVMMLEDENGNMASVTIADVKQSNGVIHVIDGVMLPAM